MPTRCPNCSHRPSQRISLSGHAAESCGCKCHDAADAAPALLAACKEAHAALEIMDGMMPSVAPIVRRLVEAITLAENSADCS